MRQSNALQWLIRLAGEGGRLEAASVRAQTPFQETLSNDSDCPAHRHRLAQFLHSEPWYLQSTSQTFHCSCPTYPSMCLRSYPFPPQALRLNCESSVDFFVCSHDSPFRIKQGSSFSSIVTSQVPIELRLKFMVPHDFCFCSHGPLPCSHLHLNTSTGNDPHYVGITQGCYTQATCSID